MKDCENLFAEYKYESEELLSFINVLIAATEQEDNNLTHNDIVHTIEILQERLTRLHDKFSLLQEKLFFTES